MSSNCIQEIKMEGLKNYLLQQLECPICFKYMSPPIRMCSKGHSTCDKCSQKYQTCIRCLYPFLTTRNLVLEEISFEVEIPCQECNKQYTSQLYYQHECFLKEKMEDTEEFCQDEDLGIFYYKCRVSELDDNYKQIKCKWTGLIKDIGDHFQKDHPQLFFDLQSSSTFKSTLPYKEDQENTSVILYNNSIFLQKVYYDDKNKNLYFSVFDLLQNDLTKNDTFYFQIIIHPNACKKNPKFFKRQVFKKYDNIQNPIQNEKNILKVDIDDFNMRKDREICWILSINQQ